MAKYGMPRSIINNKQNLKFYYCFSIILLTYSSISLAQQFTKESWKRSWVIRDFVPPAVPWQCVLTDVLEGPGVLSLPGHTG